MEAPIERLTLKHSCMAGDGSRWQLGWPGETLIASRECRVTCCADSSLQGHRIRTFVAAWQMELQAASLVFGVNIVVHQAGQPAWNIRNFPKVLHCLESLAACRSVRRTMSRASGSARRMMCT